MPNSFPEKCPICKKPVSNASKPFCSQGCKDRDLLQWLGDGYRLPGPPADYADSLAIDEKD
ncbi:MAG: DNA gyrase inhibitor YacG [Sphingomonadales bacterium]|nr:DNA gyrase inhibitor YacG [Sphingomonadales bacterium]